MLVLVFVGFVVKISGGGGKCGMVRIVMLIDGL